MSFDIYGEALRSGHCEVHPHVHEIYPCSLCIGATRTRQEEEMARRAYEDQHYAAHTEERYCREQLAQIEREYRKLAQPFVDRLVRLNSNVAPWQTGYTDAGARNEFYEGLFNGETEDARLDRLRKARNCSPVAYIVKAKEFKEAPELLFEDRITESFVGQKNTYSEKYSWTPLYLYDDVAQAFNSVLVVQLEHLERERDEYVEAAKRFAIEKAELGIENRRLKAVNHLRTVNQLLEDKDSEAAITPAEAPHVHE